MHASEIFKRFESWIEGYPEAIISVALIITALFGIYVAISGHKLAKVVLLAYWWFP